jgi:hypothetical protein
LISSWASDIAGSPGRVAATAYALGVLVAWFGANIFENDWQENDMDVLSRESSDRSRPIHPTLRIPSPSERRCRGE